MFLAFSFLTETVSKINSFFILLGRGGRWAGVGWVPPCQMRVSKQECLDEEAGREGSSPVMPWGILKMGLSPGGVRGLAFLSVC